MGTVAIGSSGKKNNFSTPTPNSDVHSAPYPLPLYPNLKINSSYSKGISVNETTPIIGN